jgi:hypothetical protein
LSSGAESMNERLCRPELESDSVSLSASGCRSKLIAPLLPS